jgi:phosphoglycerol transferase MdoB-like AlkP superfamily enzyme
MLNRNQGSIDLLTYYLISLFTLVFFGLFYKSLFVVYNYPAFSALSFSQIIYALFWGIRFDLAAAAFLAFSGSVLWWLCYRLSVFKQPALLALAVMLVFQLSLQTGDAIYFAESGRHVSYEMRDVLTDASGLFMTAISKHYWFIVLSYALGFILIFFVLKRLRAFLSVVEKRYPDDGHRQQKPVYFSVLSSAVKGLIILLLSVVLVRGGISSLPQSVLSAFKIGDAEQAVVTMNGAYSVVFGAINSASEINRIQLTLPDGTDVDQVMRTLYPLSGVPILYNGAAKKIDNLKRYNLIYILMEGWSLDFMSAYGYEVDTTPFFTEIKEKSLAPLGVIAGGVRTTEGIYATFCSQQNPLGRTIAQTSLQNNRYDCLPDILKRAGWHTAFFQGTHKETSGTGAFAQRLGFTDSYAKKDMPKGRYPHNFWGAHDADIYDYLLDKLDSMPQPFLVALNTNSTHDITIPDGVDAVFGMKNKLQKNHSVLRFSDQAMREFFEKIKHKPYYKDTIFVLLSDHGHGQHKSRVAKYLIPGVIFSEQLVSDQAVPAKNINRYVSQRDFSPTILDILGFAPSPSFAGKSFWSGNDDSGNDDVYFADYYTSGSIGWVSDNMLVETNVDDPATSRCYSFGNNLLHTTRVACSEKHITGSLNSLVFTSYSQDLLFKGEAESFYGFVNTLTNKNIVNKKNNE